MTDPITLDLAAVSATAPEVFRRVWRTALDQPGFALLRFARRVVARVASRDARTG